MQHANFQDFKDAVMAQPVIGGKVPVSTLRVDGAVLVTNKGQILPQSVQAAVLKRCKVPQTVINKMEDLAPGSREALLKMALRKGKEVSLDILFDRETREIIDWSKGYLSPRAALAAFEATGMQHNETAQYETYSRFGFGVKATLHENRQLPGEEFQVIRNFTQGLHTTTVHDTINRLWCNNGARHEMLSHMITFDGNIEKLLSRINDPGQLDWYADLIVTARETPATLGQVLSSIQALEPYGGGDIVAEDWKKYTDFETPIGASVYTDLSLWSLYNSLTWATTHRADLVGGRVNDNGMHNQQIIKTERVAMGLLTDMSRTTILTPFGRIRENHELGLSLN